MLKVTRISQSVLVSLNNAVGASLRPLSTTIGMIVDNDIVTGPNPVDQSSFFVRLHYLDFSQPGIGGAVPSREF